jgi:hypothetical protein
MAALINDCIIADATSHFHFGFCSSVYRFGRERIGAGGILPPRRMLRAALTILVLGSLSSLAAIAQSLYTLTPISTSTTLPTSIFTYVPLALNDSGQVVYYRDSAALSGDYWDIYVGNGTATPSPVYTSPGYLNGASIVTCLMVCVYNTGGFLGLNDSGDVTFAGATSTGTGAPGTVGLYGLGCTSSTPCTAWATTPVAFATGPSNAAYPVAPSGLNQSGSVAFIAKDSFPAITSFTLAPNYTTLDVPYSGTLGPPAINNNGEVVFAYNTSSTNLNFYGLHQTVTNNPGVTAGLGGQGTYINLAPGGNRPFSAPTLNDLDYSAVIVAPGLSTSVTQWVLDLVYFSTAGPSGSSETFYPLVEAGAANSVPFGGLLCSTPAINNYNQVVFVSGSNTSQGACNAMLWVDDPSGPQPVLGAGSQFNDLSGTSWTVTQVLGTGQQSINSAGSVAVNVTATTTATYGTATATNTPFILRADPMLGATPGNPYIPPCVSVGGAVCTQTMVDNYMLCENTNADGEIEIYRETWNGESWVASPPPLFIGSHSFCFPTYIDPPLAIGYMYSLSPAAPQFAGVYIPVAQAHGQSTFNVSYGGFTGTVQAGTPFSFLTQAPAGVSTFTLSGISPSANLDATSPTAFTAGLVFVPPSASAGDPLTITITPLIQTESQTITFTSSAPTTATVGGTYTVSATASSGLPVTYSIDSSTTPGACTINGAMVSFTGAGNCVIDATEAGDAAYSSVTASQTVVVTLPSTAATIRALTLEYVEASTLYQDSGKPKMEAYVGETDLICAPLAVVSPKLTKAQDTNLIDLYKRGLAELNSEGLLTSTEVATLTAAASELQ